MTTTSDDSINPQEHIQYIYRPWIDNSDWLNVRTRYDIVPVTPSEDGLIVSGDSIATMDKLDEVQKLLALLRRPGKQVVTIGTEIVDAFFQTTRRYVLRLLGNIDDDSIIMTDRLLPSGVDRLAHEPPDDYTLKSLRRVCALVNRVTEKEKDTYYVRSTMQKQAKNKGLESCYVITPAHENLHAFHDAELGLLQARQAAKAVAKLLNDPRVEGAEYDLVHTFNDSFFAMVVERKSDGSNRSYPLMTQAACGRLLDIIAKKPRHASHP